jgi:hypothetical protein
MTASDKNFYQFVYKDHQETTLNISSHDKS